MFKRTIRSILRRGNRQFALFRVDSPSQLVVGGGTVKTSLCAVAATLSMKNPFIVTDGFMVSSGKAKLVADALTEGGITDFAVFAETRPDPTTTEIEAGVEAFLKGRHDGIIALGGGSPIDTAKGIATLATNPGPFRKYKFPNPVPVKGPPLIAIPTTAGTGSEVTKVTVITDVETNEKMMCSSPFLTASAAIVDYELTLTCPARLTADNAIDSLTHAMEAYVSKKQNPYSDAVALKAMQAIQKHVRTACKDPSNHAAREELMWAATLAGLAFSNSSVALVHGMSRPLGVNFHVPHGMSNAMLLPKLTEFSIPAAEERYADCARIMGLVDPKETNAVACEALVTELKALNEELSVPTLKEYGVKSEEFEAVIETMASQALASGSPNNNPRVPSQQEIEILYREIYGLQNKN